MPPIAVDPTPAQGSTNWRPWADGLSKAVTEAQGHVADLQNTPPGTGPATTSPRPAHALVYSSTFPSVLKPATSTNLKSWTCDGVDDQTDINSAIRSVRGSTGTGSVQLLGDLFNVSGSVLHDTAIGLYGESLGTELRAVSDFQGGIIQSIGGSMHATMLEKMWLNGNDKQVHGVLYDASEGQVFTSRPSTNPDPANIIRDLLITRTGTDTFPGYGMLMRGPNLRAGKYSNLRINGVSGCGVWIDGSVDSHYTSIEIGSSGRVGTFSNSQTAPVGAGFFVSQGDNNMFNDCKAWYSRGSGFYNRGTRNGYVNCQGQDNYSAGFEDVFGKTTYSSCHADSNGQANGNAGRRRSGFYLAGSHTMVSACLSYDKAESSTTAWEQQWGFEFTTAFAYSRVVGSGTYGNGVNTSGGSRTGQLGTGSTVDIQADGNGR